jgi:hypothetical protein
MSSEGEVFSERPTFRQIRGCLPPDAKHSVLRLMPFNSRAPAIYRVLQQGIYETLAPNRSDLDKAEALLSLWSLYDRHMSDVPDSLALVIEVARRVFDTAFTFQAAEILVVAELNHQDMYVEQSNGYGIAVGLPVITDRKGGPLLPEGAVPRLHALGVAISELTSRTPENLAAMCELERVAGIWLLRLFLVYGQASKTSDTAASNKRFFDQLGRALWQAMASTEFKPNVDGHLYGRPAIVRMQTALDAAAALRSDTLIPEGRDFRSTDPDTPVSALTHRAGFPSGLLHLVIREPFPPTRDRDDRAAMEPYMRLLEPMTLARLPTVEQLDQSRAKLLEEFPWACNAIEGVFDELCARKMLGAVVLSFGPILLNGPSGSGKTRLARRLAEVLELPTHALNLGGANDAMGILSTNRGWGTAQPSPLLRPLLSGRATTVVILDEVDKPGNLARNSPPIESALLPLLEPEEARRWRDGFLQVECDLRCLLWIMTSNETTWLSSAIKSRVRIYQIRRPTSVEVRSVIGFAVRDLETEWGLPAGSFADAPISALLPGGITSLRELRRAIGRVVGAWARADGQAPRH